MKFAHHLRMLLLQRRADILLEHASAKRAHLNRPHVQSAHMISYPVSEREDEFQLGTVYALAAVAIAALVVYVNLFHEEPATMTACTQIAAK